jgi:cell division protein FtsL
VKTVTNTNDFRRYSYQSDTAYLIDSFDFSRGSQAPKLRPQDKPAEKLKVRENQQLKSRSELKREQKNAFAKAVRIAAVAVISLVMIALVLHSMALKNELTREITAKQTSIANAESEYISLQSELNSLVSMSMIDKYAVEELGMTKMRSNQIQYMNVDAYKTARQKAAEKKKAAAEKKAQQQATKTKGHN